ncbi:TonB-dependent receptor plug domain-containing protein [Phyllobacterium sp. SB3]|uniref:TonB-dependent receptor n=1 Tax=Phyllobacterium sp. SB3 TaxID=3156073 RepID=UPI0032AEF2AA
MSFFMYYASVAGKNKCLRRWRLALLCSSIVCTNNVLLPENALAQQMINYNIEAGALDTALARFGAATGVQLLYDSSSTRNIRTAGVKGNLKTEKALERLLAGTGLSYHFTAPNRVTFSGPARSSAVSARDDGSIVLNPITIGRRKAPGESFDSDTPYGTSASVNHISREDLDKTGGTSTSDIFRNTPGVAAADGRNSPSIEVNIRGIQGMNRTPIRVDGTLQSTPIYRGYLGASNRSYVDPDLLGGIDITKGPTSGANGSGSIGGVISMRTLDADDIIKDGKDWGIRVRGGGASNSIKAPSIGTFDKRIGAPGIFDIASGHGSIVAAKRFGDAEIIAGFARRSQGNFFVGKHGPNSISEETTSGNFTEQRISPVARGSEVVNTQREVISAYIKGKAEFEGGHAVEVSYIHFDSEFGEVMPSQISRFDWTNVGQQQPNTVTSHRAIAKYAYNPQDNDLIDFRFNVWGTWLDQKTRSATTIGWFPAQLQAIDTYSIVPSDTFMAGMEIANVSRFYTRLGDVSINYGGSYAWEDTKPLGSDYWYKPPDGRREEGSAFAQLNWKARSWLDIHGSLRYTTYDTADRVSYKNFPHYEKQFFDEYGITRNALSGSGWSPSVGVTIMTCSPLCPHL